MLNILNLNKRHFLAIFHDILGMIFAWYLAFLLRFNLDLSDENIGVIKETLWLVFMIQVPAFVFFGIYRGSWRFASVLDLKLILLTVISATLLLTAILFMIYGPYRVPRSVLILYPMLLILIMGGSRFFYRSFKEYKINRLYSKRGEPVIVLGAGEAAVTLLKDLAQSEEWHVVGILDDNKTLHGRDIQGVRVYGGIDNMDKITTLYGNVRRVIIAMPLSSHTERLKAVDRVTKLGFEAFTVPAIDDLISGRVSVSQVRPVDVEDLLGRHTIDLDNSGLLDLMRGKAVLVSGAGGSIGSELCRQIIKFNPSHLVCFDISEFALYQLEQELSNKSLSVKFVYIVGDIKNVSRLDKLLNRFQPKVVFHAAAYKHVPLMETENVSEAFNNNVLGTYTLAKACKKAKVGKFVLVSTDKAVNPANVMGATKRLAEMVCIGMQGKRGTRFVIVRFGNVLASSGSVIPKFRKQIKAGGPVTVTHPEIIRYFMSISEAAQLVMQAGLMGDGGEIFVLDMGEPVKIVDLAKNMIKLSGLTENEIRIEFSGLRPGEKLYEELLANDEHSLPTPHEKLRIASAKAVDAKWVELLLNWISTIHNKDEILIKAELKTWVKEYQSLDIHGR